MIVKTYNITSKAVKWRLLLPIIMLAALFAACGYKEADYSLGTANELDGRTIIISVFANDVNYSWDIESDTDKKSIEDIKTYLSISTDFLSSQAEKYGKKAYFVYDFDKNADLCYYASFDIDTTEMDSYDTEMSMNQFIETNIDSEALRRKYRADNIIYFMFINTDVYSTGISCTRNYYEGMEYPYEIVFLYNFDSGVKNCPAVYAHEILHTFGAPDLYCEDEEYNITENILSYVQDNMPNDIMYYCSDLESGEYVYDRITNEIGELDAYYIGLTDSCPLVEEFRLGQSQHIQ